MTKSEAVATGELKQRAARGVLKSATGQLLNLVLRTASMVVMARLVSPADFGLVGMVTAVIGLLSLFRDGGLPMATVYRPTLTEELLSTLFWVNVGIGLGLAVMAMVLAPAIAWFYAEPRLVWITIAMALNFISNGASAQHRALLQRRMRFGLLAAIDIASVAASTLLGITLGLAGCGYWALVAMALMQPLAAAIGIWCGLRWIPGRLRRLDGVGAMLSYGGLTTVAGAVSYLAYNVDKVLVGRLFGAEVLGHYGRAFQLVSLPGDTLSSALGSVLFPALSRLQDDPARQRSYFVRSYWAFLTIIMPIAAAFGLFAEDIVRVFLGEQWIDAIPVFRWFAPTVAAFALMNPVVNLLLANGLTVRILQMTLMVAPVLITGYSLGLPRGAIGVAAGFSLALVVLVAPVLTWALRGTPVGVGDLARVVAPIWLAVLVGAGAASAAASTLSTQLPLVRLGCGVAVLYAVHLIVLASMPGQRRAFGAIFDAVRSRR